MTVDEALSDGAKKLAAAGVPEPRMEAASLMALALRRDKAFLIAHPEYEPNGSEIGRFSSYISRRASREPFQYISGVQEFFGLDFVVSPDVLIPRPETELLVEAAIKVLGDSGGESRFCDVGTGSGCIAISILCNVPGSTGLGLDISERALAVARTNSERHHVSDRLQLTQSNVLEAAGSEEFDLIVSNPPYVPANELPTLQVEVRNFEPHSALSDGNDGLSVIRTIVDQAPAHLKKGGFLMMEIGFGQAENVLKMFLPRLWSDVVIIPDLQGIPRTVKAVLGDRK